LYFVSSNKKEVFDVQAHNSKLYKINIYSDKWYIKVLPDNKYLNSKLTGKVVNNLSEA